MSNLSSNTAASAATSPSQLERLGDHLKKLRLHKSSVSVRPPHLDVGA